MLLSLTPVSICFLIILPQFQLFSNIPPIMITIHFYMRQDDFKIKWYVFFSFGLQFWIWKSFRQLLFFYNSSPHLVLNNLIETYFFCTMTYRLTLGQQNMHTHGSAWSKEKTTGCKLMKDDPPSCGVINTLLLNVIFI